MTHAKLTNATGPAAIARFDTTVGADIDAFDALPEAIREAIRHQPYELAAEPILRAWDSPAFMNHLDHDDRLDAFVAKIWRGE